MIFEGKLDRGKILNVALNKEKEARDFYLNAVERVKRLGTKVLLKDLAEMENSHVQLISSALETGVVDTIGIPLDLQDIRLSDYLVPEKQITEQSTSQDVLIIAIHREARAEKFYIDFAGSFKGSDVETLFRRLAGEEYNHRRMLEKEYEDFYMKEM
jgi:rubrerythrin